MLLLKQSKIVLGRQVLESISFIMKKMKFRYRNPQAIQNCFRQAGFGKHKFYNEEDEIPLSELKKKITEQSIISSVQQWFNKCVELCNAAELKKKITEQSIISSVQQWFNKCVELCNADHATLLEEDNG
ncbi:hypothetical protein QE152_g22272 [Popillia japonica]|uniref:Uncharacterized protein n=1 Tax=Popillia japonica TaxID=7064 RepID=A0AAW1KJ96_POPJA